MELDHRHFLIRAFVENPPVEELVINGWLKRAVEAIKMKIVLGPHSKYVDTVGNEGITGIVVIETSHMACHVWSEISPAMIQLDVYSCAHFDSKTVIEHLNEFGLISYEYMLVDRNNEFKILEHSDEKHSNL